MELDFDKEIDALLRKAQRDAPVIVGDIASQRHLDADEISAFAENAMPENSRALYTAHLAECDRCRSVLSNLLVMNAEAAPAAASMPSAITIAERAPWYKRLFLFPNLAYVMGGLVLVFAGFLGYSVVRNIGGGDAAVVSQISVSEYPDASASGPNFQSEFSSNSNANTVMAANTAANVAAPGVSNSTSSISSNTAASGEYRTETAPVAGAKAEENKLVLDGVSSSTDAAAPKTALPPPPVAAAQPALKDDRERDDLAAKEKGADKTLDYASPESSKNNALLKQAPGAGVATQSGPMRNNENQYNRQLENLPRRPAAKRAARDEDSSSGRRVVSGKTFEKKQGVWYDVTYQGRPTINVRRGTDEFGRLDAGLRSIANSLGGTVVIVWGAKAYRIQ